MRLWTQTQLIEDHKAHLAELEREKALFHDRLEALKLVVCLCCLVAQLLAAMRARSKQVQGRNGGRGHEKCAVLACMRNVPSLLA